MSQTGKRGLWDIISDGGETRKIQGMNGDADCLGVSLPRDELRERGLGPGDEVAVVSGDGNVVEIHFPPE